MLIYIVIYLVISVLFDMIYYTIKIREKYAETLDSFEIGGYIIGITLIFSLKVLALAFAILLL